MRADCGDIRTPSPLQMSEKHRDRMVPSRGTNFRLVQTSRLIPVWSFPTWAWAARTVPREKPAARRRRRRTRRYPVPCPLHPWARLGTLWWRCAWASSALSGFSVTSWCSRCSAGTGLCARPWISCWWASRRATCWLVCWGLRSASQPAPRGGGWSDALGAFGMGSLTHVWVRIFIIIIINNLLFL